VARKPDDPPVLLDNRIGSKELYTVFLGQNVPVTLTTLAYGDCAFVGNGPHGAAPIGIERKRVTDLLQSLMSGRLVGHQLPGRAESYEMAWLVVEGMWRTSTDGWVEVRNGKGWVAAQPRVRGDALESWLLSLELRGGIRYRRTFDAHETVAFVRSLRAWWSKPWEEHKGHLALYAPPDASVFVKPSLVRRWAAELPGVGFDRSIAVDKAFPTALQMACASVQDWRVIPGIGPGIASKVVRAIQEGKG
jgi:ERCC4-type nuclease